MQYQVVRGISLLAVCHHDIDMAVDFPWPRDYTLNTWPELMALKAQVMAAIHRGI
ncbi:hypothetical protein ACS25C_19605 [Dickeya undicola]|uniref:hypothetical protein n=1 Tax=Dickeya undicola TaxID=1577887 RepID=UPI003F220036